MRCGDFMTDTNISSADNTTENNPNLNLGDLVYVLQVFRTCSIRGAFRAEELSTVGSLYDRLQAFLVASGAIKVNDKESTEDTTKE